LDQETRRGKREKNLLGNWGGGEAENKLTNNNEERKNKEEDRKNLPSFNPKKEGTQGRSTPPFGAD